MVRMHQNSLIIIGRSASGEQGLQTQVAHRSPPPRQNGLLQPFCTLCILAAQRTKAAAHLKVIFHEAYMEGAERDTSPTNAHARLSLAALEDLPGEASGDSDTAGKASVIRTPVLFQNSRNRSPYSRIASSTTSPSARSHRSRNLPS